MAKETKGLVDVVWQSRKGVDEKMSHRLINRTARLDMQTGYQIEGIERWARPNAFGQYVFHPSQWRDQELKVWQGVVDRANEMCPADKPAYWELTGDELKLVGCIHPDTLPPDPRREVADLKAKNNAAEERIAELEAMLKKADK